jgi:hypothetical protein
VDRRSFLKNSIGALLFAGLTSNKVLAGVVETLTPDSPKVLLYLIQLKNGEWKIRVTKWVDVPTKRLNEPNIIRETFKPIEVVDFNQVVSKRFFYWEKYNCSGRMGSLVSLGIPMTDEMKKEYSMWTIINHTGRKRTEESKRKISLKAKGRPSYMKGKTFSQEIRNRMSEGGKGKKLSQTHKDKIKIRMNENNPFRGKKHSEETKQILKDKHPSKIKVSCEYCGRELDLPNYKRYHGKKCLVLTNKSAVSDEQKEKTRLKLSGRTSGVSVECYSYPDLVYIKDYPNLTTACNELNLNRESARCTCVGKRKHTKNFTFRYK